MPELKTVLPNAGFVIEGYVDPTEPLRDEGPFGDHTGPPEVRSLKCELFRPVSFFGGFHSAFVIRRSLRPATIVGMPPMEDFYIGSASVKLFLPIFKMNFLEIVDLALPPACAWPHADRAEGVLHNLVFVSISKTYSMQAYKIMH